MPDFCIFDHGSIVSIEPQTQAAFDWIEENVACDPWQWLGGSLCVERRCAGPLIEGIVAAGFEISP